MNDKLPITNYELGAAAPVAAAPAPSPWERARAVYADGKSPRTFEWDLILHFEHGFVFSGPDYFLMGRPVNSASPVAYVLNPEVNWPREECDCWHVWLSICPNIETLRRLMPWPLPLVSFERGGQVRFVETDRLTAFANPKLQKDTGAAAPNRESKIENPKEAGA
jgi:hypothetical protein